MVNRNLHIPAISLTVIAILLAAILLNLISTYHPVTAQTVQQWEYKTIYLYGIGNFITGDVKKDTPSEDGSTKTLEMLNRLGTEGWELVSFTTEGLTATQVIFIFKRPK